MRPPLVWGDSALALGIVNRGSVVAEVVLRLRGTHEPGKGRHKGRLGALLVELANGTHFAVGTGFSDAERERPPAVRSVITFRYQELSDGGVPRFPSYVGIRADVKPPAPSRKRK